jgi:hypothetical protein
MRTGQALFPLGIEPGIPRVRPWKELLATGAQATWLNYWFIYLVIILLVILMAGFHFDVFISNFYVS